MLLSLVTLAAQIWFGLELSCILLANNVSFFGVIASSVPLGVSISTLIFFFSSSLVGHTFFHLLVHTQLILLGSGALLVLRLRRSVRFRFRLLQSIPNILVVAVALIFILPAYLAPFGSFVAITAPVMHEEHALAASFLYGVNSGRHSISRLPHPDRFGSIITTRWLMAYHFSMLALGWGTSPVVLLLTGFCCLGSFLMLLGALADEFQMPMLVGPIAGLIPLWTSGVGFFEFLWSGRVTVSATDFVSNIGGNATTHRLNPIFHIMVGNRENLMAMCISVLALILFFELTFCRDPNRAVKIARIAGFLIGGILPALTHQVFYGLFVFSLFHCLIQLSRQNFRWRTLNLFAAIFLSFAVINLRNYADRDFLARSFQFKTFWEKELRSGSYFPAFRCWFELGGLWPFICIFCSWYTLGIIERQYFLAMILAFATFHFWRTQPSGEDNIFVFYSFFYTLGAVFFAQFVYRMCKAERADEMKGLILGAAIVIVLLSSISVLMGLRVILSWINCWRKTEMEMATWIRVNTPRDAVFLYQPGVLHFISALTGRQGYAGAPEVLTKEGFDWERRWQELNDWIGRMGEADVPFQFILRNKDTPHDVFGKINYSRWTRVYKANRLNVYGKAAM